MLCDESCHRAASEKGRVAGNDDDITLAVRHDLVHHRQGRHHGVARPELFALLGKKKLRHVVVAFAQHLLHPQGLVTDDHDGGNRLRRGGRHHHVIRHRSATDEV